MSLIFENSYLSITPNQIVYFVDNSSDYFSICYDCKKNKDFLKNFIKGDLVFTNWAKQAINKKNKKYSNKNLKSSQNEYISLYSSKNLTTKFYDKIVKNVYSDMDYTNYLKLAYFPIKLKNLDKFIDIFIGFKFCNEQLKYLLNRAGRNLTVIYKRDNDFSNMTYEIDSKNINKNIPLTYEKPDDYAIIPCHEYLIYFYKYSFGIDNNLLIDVKKDNINYSQKEMLKYQSWNSLLLKNILNTTLNIKLETLYQFVNPDLETFYIQNFTDNTFNYNFFKEVLYLGYFMTNSITENFDEEFIKKVLNHIKIEQMNNKNITQNTLYNKYINDFENITLCKEEIEFLSFEFNFCQYKEKINTIGYYYPFNSTTKSQVFNLTNLEVSNDQIDPYSNEINFLKYFNKFNNSYKIFLGSYNESDVTDNIANKSFWIYVSFINGLKMVFFEMLNFENYINLQILFSRNMKENFKFLLTLMITICLIIFFLIFYFSIHFVEFSKKRIDSILFIKNNLFYNNLSINYFNNFNAFVEGEIVVEIVHFIRNCHKKKIKKYDIMKLNLENDIDIIKQNIYVSIKYSRKLESLVKKIFECIF